MLHIQISKYERDQIGPDWSNSNRSLTAELLSVKLAEGHALAGKNQNDFHSIGTGVTG